MATTRVQQVDHVIQSSLAARDAGALEDALHILQTGLIAFPGSPRLRLQSAWALHRIGGRFDEELAAWHSCFDVFNERSKLKWFKVCHNLIQKNYLFSAGPERTATRKAQFDDLHAKARQYLIDAPIPPVGGEEQAQIASETAAWISEWQAVEERTVQAYERHLAQFPATKTNSFYFQYAHLLFAADTTVTASEFLEFQTRVEKYFPLGPESHMSEMHVSDTGQKSGPPSGPWLQIALVLMNNGHVEHAQSILKRLPQGLDGLEEARSIAENLTRQLAAGGTEKSPAPALDISNEESIVTWSPVAASDKVIFVFAGAAGRFAFTLSFFHKLLENLGCHIVYLLDRDMEFFVRGDTWDGPAELEHKLSAIRNELGAEQSYTLGSSSGGYAALRYGIAMNVDGILCFNIPVVSPEDVVLPGVQRMFQGLQRKFPQEEFDLVTYCADAPAIPPTTIAFSEGRLPDRAAAEKLAEFTQIELVMAKGATSHDSIKTFVAQGHFFPMIERMISGPQ